METWNINRWRCAVVHPARIITLGLFVAKLSPLVIINIIIILILLTICLSHTLTQKLLEGID
jgi:hypothetical protein